MKEKMVDVIIKELPSFEGKVNALEVKQLRIDSGTGYLTLNWLNKATGDPLLIRNDNPESGNIIVVQTLLNDPKIKSKGQNKKTGDVI